MKCECCELDRATLEFENGDILCGSCHEYATKILNRLRGKVTKVRLGKDKKTKD